jgi:hypothetical protein
MRADVVWRIAVLSLAVAASASVAAGASGAAVKLQPCPETISASDPELQRTYTEFKRSVESSPLVGRLGRTVSCDARAEGDAIRLTYASPTGAKLEAHRDQSIEFTEQRLSEKGMSRQAALALLQRTERWAFGDKGCSIAWKKRPAMELDTTRGSRELVYRGDECNCQARLVYGGKVLTGWVFRSAC